MSNEHEPQTDWRQPIIYQIRLKGHLDCQWTEWFEGLIITLEDNGETLLTGPVIDQPALHGLLKKVRDLGIPLVSVNPLPGNETHSDHSNIVMIILSRLLNYRVNRWANIVVSIVTIVFVVGGGVAYPHYIFIATVEVICLLLILWNAWRWRAVEA